MHKTSQRTADLFDTVNAIVFKKRVRRLLTITTLIAFSPIMINDGIIMATNINPLLFSVGLWKNVFKVGRGRIDGQCSPAASAAATANN